ncbi:MAG TPA: sigma-70 family RNA polymerase sigma factor [Anaerolineales bacterium]|nr:sigma-70 family RNA polymerase sigma factor [Anaerolineales bacterium]
MQLLPITDELALVRRAQTDAQAFGALYDGYVQRVYRYCLYRTNNAHEAEDLTAHIFLAALEGLKRYRQDGHFAAWLFSIARNKVAEYHRRAPHESLDEALLPPLHVDLELNVEKSQRREKLLKLIQVLAEEERELIHLRYVAELSFAEIATAFKKSEDAVKKMLYRLIARLKVDMESDHE